MNDYDINLLIKELLKIYSYMMASPSYNVVPPRISPKGQLLHTKHVAVYNVAYLGVATRPVLITCERMDGSL